MRVVLLVAALQAQFGADMKDHKKFRRDYLKPSRPSIRRKGGETLPAKG